jgi:STE24 endopeptidase
MSNAANWITWGILSFLAADYLLHLVADGLNLSSMTDEIPESFESIYDPKRYRKSLAYLSAQTRFGQITSSIDLLTLVLFWFFGGFAIMDNWTRAFGLGPILTGLVYIFSLAGFKALLDQPFSFYATFAIEQRFGFNRTHWRTWVTDRLKGLLLSIGFGVPLLAGVLAFFHYAGLSAWIWCWIMITLFIIGVQFVAPTWIMPLFNRFEPIEEGNLKNAIMAYAASIHFPLENVYVMDGSKRSTKSNAFFTGFGRIAASSCTTH